jgi:ABC-type multidrug transport system fused ATPase/permease subunit
MTKTTTVRTLWTYFPRAFPYFRPYWKLGVASSVLMLLSAGVALALPWPLAVLVDSVLGNHPPAAFLRDLFAASSRHELLVYAVVAYFVLHVLLNALNILNDYVNTTIDQYMTLDLRSDLFEHCQRLSLAFHDQRRTGELMNRINYAASSVGNVVMAVPPMVESLLTLVGMFVIAYLISPELALIALVVLPFIWYALGLYGTRIVPRLERVQGLEWESLSIVHEAMSMLRVIVSFGRERHEFRRFRDQGRVAVRERVRLTVRQTGFSLGVSTVTAAGSSLVLGFGAWKVLDGQMTVGDLIVLLSYINSVYKPLEAISGTVGSLNTQLIQLKSSLDLLDLEPEVKEAPDAIEIGRARGELAFEDVAFSYRGRRPALSGVTFRVDAGQRVALVGPTGAGKTTLASLIIRLWDPARGRIVLDGVDIRRLTLESLREQISVVLQEPLLFSGTIAENIGYGRLDAGLDEIVEAAKAANAHEFIAALPEGYNTRLGERGPQLSGGERQRVCVARAFIKDAPILILDEPTSSIDSKTEGVILDALDRLMIGRTTFMIAHRLSTIRHADVILVLNRGELVEHGTHDDLLERGGLYRQLYEAQHRPRPRAAVGPRLRLQEVAAEP